MPRRRLTEKAQEFCKKYDIDILNDTKRKPIYSSITTFFVDPSSKDIMHSVSRRLDEPVLTVDIPLRNLEELANTESVFYNNIENSSHRRIFETWIAQQQQEKALRVKYAAVDKAYRDYSALLTWVSNHPNDEFKGFD